VTDHHGPQLRMIHHMTSDTGDTITLDETTATDTTRRCAWIRRRCASWTRRRCHPTLGAFAEVRRHHHYRRRRTATTARKLGLHGATASKPEFPLARDVASWLLLTIIAAGAMLLHKQWRLMARCIHELADNGALVNREEIRHNWLARRLGVVRMLKRGHPEQTPTAVSVAPLPRVGEPIGQHHAPEQPAPQPADPLAIILARIMKSLVRRRKWISSLLGLASLVLASLLVDAQRHGLFQNLAPTGMTGQARQDWLNQAYASWWASDHHPAGQILYFVFAVFVILSFNEVGIIAVYLVVVLNMVAQTSADWLNRDGRYYRPANA